MFLPLTLFLSLSQVINIIDPGAIVLGGGVSNMKQIYGNINSKLKNYSALIIMTSMVEKKSLNPQSSLIENSFVMTAKLNKVAFKNLIGSHKKVC